MLEEELLAAGISNDQIRVIPDEAEAVDAALEAAEEGDLVLIFGDQIDRTWRQITGSGIEEPAIGAGHGAEPVTGEVQPAEFDPGVHPPTSGRDVAGVAAPGAGPPGGGPPGLEWPADWSLDFDLEERKLVRDERGVRIAREPED